jgi:hypothetical protein
MNLKEKELAICQMVTLNTVLSGGTMDIRTAITQLNLDNEECRKLAEKENLTWIAENIWQLLLFK